MYVCMHACMHACMYVCMYVDMLTNAGWWFQLPQVPFVFFGHLHCISTAMAGLPCWAE